MMKKSLKTFLFAFLVLLILLSVGGYYMVDYALTPPNRGKDIEGSYEYMYKEYPHLRPYMDSLQQTKALRDTFITTIDGIRLHGFYVKASVPTRQTAVIVHGYTDNAIRMMMIGYMYNQDLGFNILLPDLRYSGLSEGNHLQMGWFDRKDVAQWINLLPTLFGDSIEVVVHGISMGAATTMMLAGDPQPEYIKCFVEDCGYTSVWDEFKNELKEQFKQLLFIDSITIRIWVAHHILEVMNYDDETRAAALKEIALAKRLSEPSYALGNKIWLEKWLQKYPDDADLLL